MSSPPPPPTAPTLPQQPGPPSRGPGRWLLACGGGCALLALVALVAAVLGWDAFSRWGMGTDVADYRSRVQACELEPAAKEALLARLDRIAERLEKEDMSFLAWVDADAEISRLLSDRLLSEEELEELDRQLTAIERAFD